jgi:hypothetical protein
VDALNGLLGAITALLVALTAFLPVAIKLWRRDNVTDQRVDRLVQAHLNRGFVEASREKLTRPVPAKGDNVADVLLRADVRRAYEPIAPALRRLKKSMPGATSGQFAEAVERDFGQWLAKHICAVLNVSDYACWAMAQLVAEDEPENASRCETDKGRT